MWQPNTTGGTLTQQMKHFTWSDLAISESNELQSSYCLQTGSLPTNIINNPWYSYAQPTWQPTQEEGKEEDNGDKEKGEEEEGEKEEEGDKGK